MAVGSEVKKLKGLGYAQIPRHIEEAVVSLVNVTKEFPDLEGFQSAMIQISDSSGISQI